MIERHNNQTILISKTSFYIKVNNIKNKTYI